MTATKMYRLYEDKQDPENKRINDIRIANNMAPLKFRYMKRAVPIPADSRFRVADCGQCGRAIMGSHGQLFRKGPYGMAHRKCRGRGKNKLKGY